MADEEMAAQAADSQEGPLQRRSRALRRGPAGGSQRPTIEPIADEIDF